jgi:hypothetical protein
MHTWLGTSSGTSFSDLDGLEDKDGGDDRDDDGDFHGRFLNV